MPTSAQQWRLAVGQANASRSLRPCVTGQPKMKLTLWDILLFVLTSLLGAILLGATLSKDGEKETSEKKCVSWMSGGGGTVGELVPSLLTAPWRKELLILAGDVETNPGPYTVYGLLRESDLELVMEELRGVEEKWESIGRELSQQTSVVNKVYQYSPDDIRSRCSAAVDCLRETISQWLQCANFPTPTWTIIIDVLRKAGEPHLADSLTAKYISDLLDESDLDLLTQELRPAQHKWESIGNEFPHYFYADGIRRQYYNDGDRLSKMLREQLQDDHTTWRNIVDALRSPSVRESQLADELEAKYCPNLLSVSAVPAVMKELSVMQKKWRIIGEELGVKKDTLDRIHAQHSDVGNCLREVLSERVGSQVTSWGDVIAVLRTPHVGEFQLADHLEAKYYPTSQKILEEALKKGYVDCHIWKVLVTGAAGSGKTSLKYRLFGKELPTVRCSTALAEAAIRAISREIVGTDLTGWFKVTPDELMAMLGGALKAGVPMEENMLQSGTPEAVIHEQPTNVSTTEENKLSIMADHPVDKSPKATLKTAEAAVYKQPTKDSTTTTGYSKQSEGNHHFVVSSPLHLAETSVASPHANTISVPAQASSSKGELVQLVEKSKGSKRFLELQWIHFIDSGGQPQFHEVLPAFIRNTTATIFVMKLSERLDEHPMIEYYDINGQICGKPYRHALSNDQMLQCCIRTIHSQQSTKEGKHKTLVVGTHRDLESLCSESQAEKNKKLVDILTPSLQDHLVFYHPFTDVIFPINAKSPNKQDHQVCDTIRKQIENKKCAPPHKIPIGWFLLEQDIIELAKGGVISKKECLSIAALLNINAAALKAALEYFDNLNIFLYYPSVLSEVVFSNPQILLNKVTELVHFSYSLRSDSPPIAVEGKWRQFSDKGIVKREMFQDDRFSAHYIPDLFTPTDLIKLLQHLLIIAPLSSTEYFMPSLLQMITPEEVNKQLPPLSSAAAPLLVHFPAGCAQNGVFCALIVYLISVSGWKFARGRTPYCVSRNCICFQLPGKPACITLVDSFAYFELHVKAPNTMYPELCPMIRVAIFSGLKAAAESLNYNNSTPVPAFVCNCSSSPHAATFDDQGRYMICTTSTNYPPLTKQHTVWLQTLPSSPVAEGVETSTAQVMMSPTTFQSVLQHTQAFHDQRPLDNQLHTLVRQPHVPHPEPSYHLLSHQDTRQPSSYRLESDIPPVGPPQEVTSQGVSLQPGKQDQILHLRSQGKRPNLLSLLNFPGKKGNINIPKLISTKYFMFGILLLNDETGAEVNAIVSKYHEDAEQINLEILRLWIEGKGKPLSWDTLIDVLKATGLNTLAEDINDGLQH